MTDGTTSHAAARHLLQRRRHNAARMAASRITNLVCSHGRAARAAPRHNQVRSRGGSGAYEPKRSPGHQQCGGHLRKNEPAVRNKRHGETDGGPGEPRDASAGQQRRQIEDRQRRERAKQAQHRHRTEVSRNGVCRHQQRGQTWRVYRVDHFVQAAPEKSGRRSPPKYSR